MTRMAAQCGLAALLDRAVDQRRIEQPTIGTEGEGVLRNCFSASSSTYGLPVSGLTMYALNELDRMLAPIG